MGGLTSGIGSALTLLPPPGLVHIWVACPTYTAAQAAWALPSLAQDEVRHLHNLRQVRDQWRYAVARAYLRHLLAHYLGCAPQAVPLIYGQYGKPCLTLPHTLQFNLSHAGDILLAAASVDRAVGVDVEQIDLQMDWQPLARRLWPAAIAVQDRSTFYQYWCCHEALLKAVGCGWAGPEFELVEGFFSGKLVIYDGLPGMAQTWLLRRLAMPPSYVAALAVQGSSVEITHCQPWPR